MIGLRNFQWLFLAVGLLLASSAELSAGSNPPRVRDGICDGVVIKLTTEAELARARKQRHPERWGYYTCKKKGCGATNTAAPLANGKRHCHNCGEAHTDEEFRPFPDPNSERFPESDWVGWETFDARFFHSGKSWQCDQEGCRASNFSVFENCVECGSPNPEATTAEEIKLAPLPSRPLRSSREIVNAPRQDQLPADQLPQHQESRSTSSEQETRGSRGQEQSPRDQALSFAQNNRWYLTGAAVLVAGAAAFSEVTPGEDEVEAQVSQMEWKRRMVVERFVKVTKQAPRPSIQARDPRMPVAGQNEIPGAFNIRNCKDVGRFEVCDYDTYEWQIVLSEELSGDDTDALDWPQHTLQEDERRKVTQAFTIQIEYQKGKKEREVEISVADPAVFDSIQTNEEFKLLLDPSGAPARIRRENGQLIYLQGVRQ